MLNLVSQLPLPNFEQFITLNRFALGNQGENMVYNALSKAGYRVVYTRRGWECGDLKAIHPLTGEIFRVEVKTARQGTDKKWRFTLHCKGTSHVGVDFVVLLAVVEWGKPVAFVIPQPVVACQHRAVISSDPKTYGGKLAPYRQALEQLTLGGVQ